MAQTTPKSSPDTADTKPGGARPLLLNEFERDLLSLLFLIAGALIVASLFAPALHVDRFWFFRRDISLIDGIVSLMNGGQAALGWAILTLSVVLPAAKTALGLLIAGFARQAGGVLRTWVGVFSFLGKWSLADVFVLAVLVMVIDGQILTRANLGPGAYLFASGVALSTLATAWLHGAVRRARHTIAV